jgi:GT2 family glycosyltransferase
VSGSLSVAAVVLGVDRLEKTRVCVESLLRCEGWHPRILVLDNGSRDGTGAAIGAEFPGVRVEHSSVNLGAAAGRNLAVAAATEAWVPDLLLFVDDDAEVHPAAIAATCAKMRHPGEPPRIYVAGGSRIRFWIGDTSPRGHGELDVGQYDRPGPCVPGAGCMMVRRRAFEEAGGFDPGFDPYGYEDLDLSLRLIEAGWRILYVPEALAWHERGNSLGNGRFTARYAEVKRRNWIRFLNRHGSIADRVGFWTVGAPLRLARALVRELVRGNLSGARALLGL